MPVLRMMDAACQKEKCLFICEQRAVPLGGKARVLVRTNSALKSIFILLGELLRKASSHRHAVNVNG